MSKTQYSIKDLENFTQIKAHTIRIWEQRYGLLNPFRTDTNIRYYSEKDLKKILNINLLYNSGFKISKIAKLSEEEITSNAKSLILNSTNEHQSEIDKLLLLILELNGAKIEAFINDALKETSLIEVYKNLFVALFKKMGELWQVDSINIVNEHYFSNIFRQFLISEIQKISVKQKNPKRALLFLHDTEEHEFSILVYQYILKSNGYDCHYFGQKAPINELLSTVKQINPNLVILTFTSKVSDKFLIKATNVLDKIAATSKVIVSGNQLNNMTTNFSKNILKIDSIEQLTEWIEKN